MSESSMQIPVLTSVGDHQRVMSSDINTHPRGGRLIPLSSLPEPQKRQRREALKQQDPAKAALIKSLPTDPFIQALQTRFGAELVMEEGEIQGLLL